jgi:hypothetical protein
MRATATVLSAQLHRKGPPAVMQLTSSENHRNPDSRRSPLGLRKPAPGDKLSRSASLQAEGGGTPSISDLLIHHRAHTALPSVPVLWDVSVNSELFSATVGRDRGKQVQTGTGQSGDTPHSFRTQGWMTRFTANALVSQCHYNKQLF